MPKVKNDQQNKFLKNYLVLGQALKSLPFLSKKYYNLKRF
jgi:hypothetical protein